MDPEGKLRLAADPSTPGGVLAQIVLEGRGDQRPFLLALENPSLPFDVWAQHLRFARAWNNPSAALYLLSGLAVPHSVLIEHLATLRNVGKFSSYNPFTPFAVDLLKRQLDGLWPRALDLKAAVLLDVTIEQTKSYKLRYVSAHLSLLLAETLPLNNKQKRVLADVRGVLTRYGNPCASLRMGGLMGGSLPSPPDSEYPLINEHVRAAVYGPHRAFDTKRVWTAGPNFRAALTAHRLLGTKLNLSPVQQAFFERYPTLWVTQG